MELEISSRVREKLQGKRPPVTRDEILQCFANRGGRYLIDNREDNRTDPPTQWFVAETDFGRRLKVAFVFDEGAVHIKTAYDPNHEEIRIYDKYS